MNAAASNASQVGDQTAKPSNFNLPNVLTSLRIILIPLFVWLVLRADDQHLSWMWGAFALFVALMITDKLDGDIARARGLVTDFGKIADPIADKALMTSALVCLNITGVLPWWVTVVIVIREFGITMWRMFQLRAGRVVPASKGGKLKTALQTLAVGLYLCPLPEWMNLPTWIVMLAAVAVTVYTGIQYLIDSRRISDDDSDRN
ncbi:Putative CDP-diacylglycerol--glycerol-3-phosphate 3-phosphatidyl-transferase 2 [Corynebacterium occultum]|uniref:CDP-diacylglycerol--glycerol-3-phosphate 3-phosphatidyltransferase n=1 Tax=Corynebacterium occultum TaxID=2675219 RepID=A0A6B8VPY2_9CORY|nr:CDP-diacylglycerol--glycerol-3-phosphate 3-phosphatidyltransferase [Corynebacterium occultum]QGU07642.1 Putative CDP-diacylglycerol--glycerol-3-phosphate 3-phosphatidyl-transferase 2 [Corynebacterium occultum]